MSNLEFKKSPSSKESGVLALLWRKILSETGLNKSLHSLINLYLAGDENTKSKVIKKKSRSTLIDNITSSDMTIKTFMDLVFNLLNAKSLTITVDIEYGNSKKSSHKVLTKKLPHKGEEMPDG